MAGDTRRCESCRAVLGRTSRPDRRYCSPACRQSAYEWRRGSRPIAVVTRAEQTEIDRILAQATREERLVALVAQAAAKNWRAAAWLLAQRYPERWAKPSRVAVEVAPPASSEVETLFADLDQLAARRARKERR